ncbi:hypothetical protein CYQ11_02965 [Streptomyces cinnamoneus]|nr:hypothetical protein CYQ11_02965 [Streptomyces cinnamoneus]
MTPAPGGATVTGGTSYPDRHTDSVAVSPQGQGGALTWGPISLSDAGTGLERRTIVFPWNSPGLGAANTGDVDRAVAAFQAYVRLALCCSPGQRAPACERAHYLRERLTSGRAPDLEPAGRRLVERLGALLDTLSPAPPPGCVLRLLLHRYVREARRVEHGPAARDLAAPLARLARAEFTVVRVVLAGAGAWEELGGLSAALRTRPFWDVRRLAAATLLRLAPDGYSLNALAPAGAGAPDDRIRAMVEASSRELALLGALG